MNQLEQEPYLMMKITPENGASCSTVLRMVEWHDETPPERHTFQRVQRLVSRLADETRIGLYVGELGSCQGRHGLEAGRLAKVSNRTIHKVHDGAAGDQLDVLVVSPRFAEVNGRALFDVTEKVLRADSQVLVAAGHNHRSVRREEFLTLDADDIDGLFSFAKQQQARGRSGNDVITYLDLLLEERRELDEVRSRLASRRLPSVGSPADSSTAA